MLCSKHWQVVPAARGPAHAARSRVRAAPHDRPSWKGLTHWLANAPTEAVEKHLQAWQTGFEDYWTASRGKHWTDWQAETQKRKEERDMARAERRQPVYIPSYLEVQRWPGPDGPAFLTIDQTLQHASKDVVKYGEMVQAVYDTLLTSDVTSVNFGKCAPGAMKEGDKLSMMADHGVLVDKDGAGQYQVTRQIQGASGPYRLAGRRPNYMGFVAIGPNLRPMDGDTQESDDVSVVFRGTITRNEWIQDFKSMFKVLWTTEKRSPDIQYTALPFELNPFKVLPVMLGIYAVTQLVFKGQNDLQSVEWAVGCGLIYSILAGIWKDPEVWWLNMKGFYYSFLPWCNYGTTVLKEGLFASAHEVTVAYGFKEMYCEGAAGSISQKHKPGTEHNLACPRLTVLKELADILEGNQNIRTITIAGHSLGGSLASMCGYDLSTAIEAAKDAHREGFAVYSSKLDDNKTYTMDQLVQHHRSRFIACCQERIKSSTLPECMPISVGVITFAAPKVGNMAYSRSFRGPPTLMHPLSAAERVANDTYNPDILGKFGMLVRDFGWQALKTPTYVFKQWLLGRCGADERMQLQSRSVAMLRIDNAHDLAPYVPPKLTFAAGGYQLLLNSYYVYYFKADKFKGPPIGARHNLEMYLHLIDPTRDRALVNKSDDILVPEARVPARWWDPFKNNGMQFTDVKLLDKQGRPTTKWAKRWNSQL